MESGQDKSRIFTKALDWILPFAWLSVILLLSSNTYSSPNTELFIVSILKKYFPILLNYLSHEVLFFLNYLIRKTAHFVEYGILGILFVRAIVGEGKKLQPKQVIIIIAIIFCSALLDEGLQTTQNMRSQNFDDVMVDCVGGFMPLFLRS